MQKSEDRINTRPEEAVRVTSQQIDHSKAAQFDHVSTVDSKECPHQDETVLPTEKPAPYAIGNIITKASALKSMGLRRKIARSSRKLNSGDRSGRLRRQKITNTVQQKKITQKMTMSHTQARPSSLEQSTVTCNLKKDSEEFYTKKNPTNFSAQ